MSKELKSLIPKAAAQAKEALQGWDRTHIELISPQNWKAFYNDSGHSGIVGLLRGLNTEVIKIGNMLENSKDDKELRINLQNHFKENKAFIELIKKGWDPCDRSFPETAFGHQKPGKQGQQLIGFN